MGLPAPDSLPRLFASAPCLLPPASRSSPTRLPPALLFLRTLARPCPRRQRQPTPPKGPAIVGPGPQQAIETCVRVAMTLPLSTQSSPPVRVLRSPHLELPVNARTIRAATPLPLSLGRRLSCICVGVGYKYICVTGLYTCDVSVLAINIYALLGYVHVICRCWL